MKQHKWHKENKELNYKTYNTGKIFIEGGWYSKEYIKAILDSIERQDKHTKEMIGYK